MLLEGENSLPNYRTADKCCCNCKHFDSGYEGEGDCRILLKLKKEKQDIKNDIWVYATISDYNLCDLWEME
jgi:hypothetical protein